jgi:hypothetical protein
MTVSLASGVVSAMGVMITFAVEEPTAKLTLFMAGVAAIPV